MRNREAKEAIDALWAGICFTGVLSDKFRRFPKPGQVVEALPAATREKLKNLRAEHTHDRLDYVRIFVDDRRYDQYGREVSPSALLRRFDRTVLEKYHREKGII
jgi:hypothetical protein